MLHTTQYNIIHTVCVSVCPTLVMFSIHMQVLAVYFTTTTGLPNNASVSQLQLYHVKEGDHRGDQEPPPPPELMRSPAVLSSSQPLTPPITDTLVSFPLPSCRAGAAVHARLRLLLLCSIIHEPHNYICLMKCHG